MYDRRVFPRLPGEIGPVEGEELVAHPRAVQGREQRFRGEGVPRHARDVPVQVVQGYFRDVRWQADPQASERLLRARQSDRLDRQVELQRQLLVRREEHVAAPGARGQEVDDGVDRTA